MLYGISVILYYIILIVSYYIFIVRLTKGKNLSPRQRRAYGQAFLFIFMFSSLGLTLMLPSFGLTYINNPALLVLILLIILFNFLSFLVILDAIDDIRKSNSHKNPPQYSQQLLYTQQQTFKSFKMVKYCPKCGYPNPDDAMYCVRCGTPLATVQPQPQSAPQQPINYPQQPPQTQPPQYPQQPNPPPVYPPYQQYPYPKRRFPIKAVIGAVIAVVVVLVVVFVVLPIFIGPLPIFIRPSYPITVSDLQSIYGGSWKVNTSSSYVISISTSSVTISYFNGTKKTLPVTPSNDTCSVLFLGKEPDSYLSKEVFVTFSYRILVTAYDCLVSNAVEVVVYPVAGSPLYTELTTMGEGAFANTFGVSFVTVNGNIMYGYYNGPLAIFGPWVVILNKANGELVMIAGLPYINSTIASELASHV
jgi:hypothetical protein